MENKQTSENHPTKNLSISFNESGHSYVDSEGHYYTSVTTLINRYFTPFDFDKWANYTALKEGVSEKEIRERWFKNGFLARRLGTYVHKIIESNIKGGDPTPIYDEAKNNLEEEYFSQFEIASKVFCEKLNSLREIAEKCEIRSEKIIFDPELRLAGTVDLLLKTNDGWVLGDWKTNKTIISKDNRFNKFGIGVCKNVPDTNFGHYSLQLSLYKYIILRNGYLPKNEKIVKLMIFQPNYEEKTIQEIEIDELDVSELVDDFHSVKQIFS